MRKYPPAGFIEPCLPSPLKKPPSGPGWIHEIKHDGFRIVAYREAQRVRLFTRNANDLADRFPAIVRGIRALKVKSCTIDGEAIATDADGLSVFSLLRRDNGGGVILCAFDIVELNGEDLRREPIEARKKVLQRLLKRAPHDLVFNEVFDGDGSDIYQRACALGCEGIVSKRLGSPYQSGRSSHWFKIKNPKAPAVRREAEIKWR